MHCIDEIEIDWMQSWANSADIHVKMNKEMPKEWVYKEYQMGRGSTFVAVNDPWVKFLHYDPIDQTGFYGSEFQLLMDDGSTRRIKGPWSSRCGVVNQIEGVPQSTEIIYHCGKGCGCAGIAMQVKYLEPLLEKCGLSLKKGTREPNYVVVDATTGGKRRCMVTTIYPKCEDFIYNDRGCFLGTLNGKDHVFQINRDYAKYAQGLLVDVVEMSSRGPLGNCDCQITITGFGKEKVMMWKNDQIFNRLGPVMASMH